MSHALQRERERAGTRTSVIVLIVLLVALGLGGFGWTAGGRPMPLWATLVGASVLLVCGIAAVLLAVAGPQSDDEFDKGAIQPRGMDTSGVDEPDGEGPVAVESRSSPTVVERMWLPLAARLRSLLLRQIQDVDALEHEVEDPVLLNGLFRVDHSAVQALRLAETIGVLGGQPVDRSTRDAVPVRRGAGGDLGSGALHAGRAQQDRRCDDRSGRGGWAPSHRCRALR